EVAHCSGNFRGVGLQREVSGIKKAHDRAWIVAFERLGTHREEEWIVLAPHSQETRLVSAEILLESRVERDVALVITEQVWLQLIGAGPGQVKVIQGVAVGRNQGRVGYAVRVLPVGRLRREQGAERFSVLLRGGVAVGPGGRPL